MSRSTDRLRAALDQLAIDDDVNAAHARVAGRARSIRRRRRAVALAVVAVVAFVASVAVIANGRGHVRVVVSGPSTVAPPTRIVAVVAGHGLVELDPANGNVLATLDDTDHTLGWVSASPDGASVYYVSGASSYDPRCGRARIMRHLMDEAPGVATVVAAGVFPAVDPTGTRLAYLTCAGSSGYTDTLVVRDLNTGTERRIPVNPRDRSWWATPPHWSPDGQAIAARVVQGPAGGSPLRILDLAHDASFADARVVWFSDSGDIFGYLGATGELLGANGNQHGARIIGVRPTQASATQERTLFTVGSFPFAAAADPAGDNVLAITPGPTGGTLHVWSEGEPAPTTLPGNIDFAAWLSSPPNTHPPGPPGELTEAFSRTSPDGARVLASTGSVSIAEAHGCAAPVPGPPTAGPNCAPGTAPGAEFDFSAPGTPHFRLTVLTADFPVDSQNPMRPVGINALIRVVQADGSTIPADSSRSVDIAAIHSTNVATIRVHTSDGNTEEMTPVNGWAAFAARTHGELRFVGNVDGLDMSGSVIATSLPERCC